MLVSVVIPTYRRPDLLSRCLAALARQQFGGEFEVIVADDGADEPTRRLVENMAAENMAAENLTVENRTVERRTVEGAESATTRQFRPRYVTVTGVHGPAAARNIGWRQARGEIIAFTDDDCIPDSRWLAAGVEPFRDGTVGAVTGQTIVPLPPRPTDFERNTAGLEHCEFITANCFCRRAVLEALGGFDEQFTTAWREDSDLHFRLLDSGYPIIRAPQAVVVHPVRQAVWGVSLREQRKALFEALLFRKHPARYRRQIFPQVPWRYYASVAAAMVGLFALLAGQRTIFLCAGAAWLGLTVDFAARRLRAASRTPAHVLEMLFTSALIPFLSVYWRLRGAARYRVLFW